MWAYGRTRSLERREADPVCGKGAGGAIIKSSRPSRSRVPVAVQEELTKVQGVFASVVPYRKTPKALWGRFRHAAMTVSNVTDSVGSSAIGIRVQLTS